MKKIIKKIAIRLLERRLYKMFRYGWTYDAIKHEILTDRYTDPIEKQKYIELFRRVIHHV